MRALILVVMLLLSGGLVSGCASNPSTADGKRHTVAEADEAAETSEGQATAARGVCGDPRTTGRNRSSCQRGVQVMSRDALQDELRHRAVMCTGGMLC